ncbi:hypothetical protein A3G14_05435 [Candidatus Curtissbacteria bacterium RIFCSPLOWO2_12_FULL_38_9]|uniref:Glycosyltransferase subfamily 4-like N-terminal domain-containing protein n=1 Tax=Candidatus Curtissbacteria bacterium RIFCSPLOWO2_12_FULL_38_9 TaxID=1797735 RepID=A0A1F5IAB8_9BACT|nr:MAG: hypothetical protein A2775_00160 [Candidatus Curtissbacteria bacterium RIFCSPHIGHO2_01_FULL_39_57]OGD90064.1 MAG: hypothetical protein A3E11_01365 [Candidatus Curtissbacteria bacterium RIFCSPHIGHO2_12_FULL_38_37]OGE13295.1 MAG: hypothetical protein A3G14_05435 [Candidatus Curtissbacteria bacterium RIFCSPLOWO2_12_FULL_38_9]
MKVAVLIDTWFPFMGGGQINAWEISKRLAKQGVEIDIVTRNCGRDKLKRVKNITVYKLGSKSAANNSLSKILFLFKSYYFISKKNYDLIHAHAFLPGITARLLMVLKGIPAIFTVHGTSIGTNLNNIFSRWLEKFILTQIRYSAQITVSQDFLKIKNINENVYYIPNGVDVKKFDKVNIKKFKRPTLLFVGRLNPQKNLQNLIVAMDLVRKKLSSAQLLIVGSGILRNDLIRLVEKLKLQKNVKLLGQKTGDDLVTLYKSVHIFVLPSIYEGQPLSLLEAWAAKLPAIVSKTGDCQYLVKGGQNGYLIGNANHSVEIARLVVKAFKNKNLAEFGQNGYNLVKEKFSWDKSTKLTLDLYEKITKSQN